MSENKTKPTAVRPQDFIAGVGNDRRRQDAEVLLALFGEVSGELPKMWGLSIIGFGDHHYVHSSGREGDTGVIGFSPRKANLVLYGLNSAPGSAALLEKLGKHKSGVVCVSVNKLADVDLAVLRRLAELGYEHMSNTTASFVPR
ncbi:MAG TPA: hypothetical protein VFD39_00950 [Trueperaceae bacterium]|nr:hypothetical protein [Trueperaceae bacterium]